MRVAVHLASPADRRAASASGRGDVRGRKFFVVAGWRTAVVSRCDDGESEKSRPRISVESWQKIRVRETMNRRNVHIAKNFLFAKIRDSESAHTASIGRGESRRVTTRANYFQRELRIHLQHKRFLQS
jgi:hypothetical protein